MSRLQWGNPKPSLGDGGGDFGVIFILGGIILEWLRVDGLVFWGCNGSCSRFVGITIYVAMMVVVSNAESLLPHRLSSVFFCCYVVTCCDVVKSEMCVLGRHVDKDATQWQYGE
jgi:hypothetical protein